MVVYGFETFFSGLFDELELRASCLLIFYKCTEFDQDELFFSIWSV